MNYLRQLWKRHPGEIVVVTGIALLLAGYAVVDSRERAALVPEPTGSSASRDLQPGMIFDIRDGPGGEASRVKIVRVERGGVHIVLMEEPAGAQADDQFSMEGMHLPLSMSSWRASQPRKVGQETVTKADLEGYEIWKEDGGGYFE